MEHNRYPADALEKLITIIRLIARSNVLMEETICALNERGTDCPGRPDLLNLLQEQSRIAEVLEAGLRLQLEAVA